MKPNLLEITDFQTTNSNIIYSLDGLILSGNIVIGTERDYLLTSVDIHETKKEEDTHAKFFGQNIKRVIEAFK